MKHSFSELQPRRTPLRSLRVAGRTIHVKDETRQTGGSFKFRGPSRFFDTQRVTRTVVTASTGNHATGMSLAARMRGLDPVVFVPETTPAAKSDRIIAAGGSLRPVPGGYEDALAEAQRYAAAEGLTFVPSYDHDAIVEGNRSIYAEARTQFEGRFDRVFVPVGGGGCVSGAIREFARRPIDVVACEYAPVSRIERIALRREVAQIDTAGAAEPSMEGVAIRTLGEINKDALRGCDRLSVTAVGIEEIRRACRLLHRELGIVAELGASIAVAAALSDDADATALCVVTGGNIDPALHSEIIGGADE